MEATDTETYVCDINGAVQLAKKEATDTGTNSNSNDGQVAKMEATDTGDNSNSNDGQVAKMEATDTGGDNSNTGDQNVVGLGKDLILDLARRNQSKILKTSVYIYTIISYPILHHAQISNIFNILL